MKRILLASLLATGVGLQAFAQENNPPPALPTAQDGVRLFNQDPNAQPNGQQPGGPRQPMRRSPADRLIDGGDIEGAMFVRLLTNPRMAQQFGIDEELRKTLEATAKEYDDAISALRPSLEEALEVQTKLLAEETPDEAAILKSVDDLWELRTEIAKIQMKKLLAVRAKLTPEQLKKINDMIANFRNGAGFGGRPGQRGPGGQRGQWQNGGQNGGQNRRRPENNGNGGNQRPPQDLPRRATTGNNAAD